MRIVRTPESSTAECNVLVMTAFRAKAPQRGASWARNFTFWIFNVWQRLWSFVNWSYCVLAWLVWVPWGLCARDNRFPDGAFPAKICFLLFVSNVSNYPQMSQSLTISLCCCCFWKGKEELYLCISFLFLLNRRYLVKFYFCYSFF